jgi:tetratricopeptide (TPR) repeat protein
MAMPKRSTALTAPNPDIFLMENHDEAYWIWREAGVRDQILVHIDAHDDMDWLPDPAAINIANFICWALQEGMIREVYWVAPDRTWENRAGLNHLLRRLKYILRKYPDPFRLSVEQDRIRCLALGKHFQICPLSALPAIAEPVLLDIDVDYLVIPRASRDSDQFRELPWRWPDELVQQLEARSLRAELVTIAYSVKGGFTPLKWKYLGEELAERLQGADERDSAIRGMLLLRQGARTAAQGGLAQAVDLFFRAGELLPHHPAPDLHLAEAYLDLGQPKEAQERYRRALEQDSSYRAAYSSGGFWYYFGRCYGQAEEQHRRTLALDPEDPNACLGLGQLALLRKRWMEAETWARKALELDNCLVDAYRVLGRALFKQGRIQEAIAAYEKSLHLSLRGYMPITGPIHSFNETGLLMDPRHFKIHTILGQLFYLQNDFDAAIISFRMSIAGGDNGCVTRNRLARLYLRQCRWADAAQEAWAAIRMIPRDVWKAAQETYYCVRYAVKNRYRTLAGTR